MFNLNLNVQPQTAKRLKKVLEYSRDEETFAQNIIAYQVAELKRGILNLKLDTKEYEKNIACPARYFMKNFNRVKWMTAKRRLCGRGYVRCWKKMKNNFWGRKDD
jgi:hypothetical protein